MREECLRSKYGRTVGVEKMEQLQKLIVSKLSNYKKLAT
jgi:hypothetical protein